MPMPDYPVDVREDYPTHSSRGWACSPSSLIKLLALIPHFVILFFLSIAQVIVAFVAQVVVAFQGRVPGGDVHVRDRRAALGDRG